MSLSFLRIAGKQYLGSHIPSVEIGIHLAWDQIQIQIPGKVSSHGKIPALLNQNNGILPKMRMVFFLTFAWISALWLHPLKSLTRQYFWDFQLSASVYLAFLDFYRITDFCAIFYQKPAQTCFTDSKVAPCGIDLRLYLLKLAFFISTPR